jgi:hypothetical protein
VVGVHNAHNPLRPKPNFFTAPCSCPNPGIQNDNCSIPPIPPPDFMVAATNEECSRPRRGGRKLKFAGKEKKIRVATKQVSPLDVHRPRSAVTPPSPPNPPHKPLLLDPCGLAARSDPPLFPPVLLVSLPIPRCALRSSWCLCALRSFWCPSLFPRVSSGAPGVSWVLQ